MTTGIAVLAGLLTGVLSGFGIGGGSLLLLYLTLAAGMRKTGWSMAGRLSGACWRA